MQLISKIDSAVEKAKEDFESFIFQTKQQFIDNATEIQKKYDELPDYIRTKIDDELNTHPEFLIKEFPEYLIGAHAGIDLAKTFNSYSEWENFLKNPANARERFRNNMNLTPLAVQIAIDVANGYVDRNLPKIQIAK